TKPLLRPPCTPPTAIRRPAADSRSLRPTVRAAEICRRKIPQSPPPKIAAGLFAATTTVAQEANSRETIGVETCAPSARNRTETDVKCDVINDGRLRSRMHLHQKTTGAETCARRR